MSEDTALAIRQNEVLTPADIIAQVALIQQVMSGVMHEGEHYGKIPGCGDKPSLLKPGAEKLAMTFRLAPSYHRDVEKLDNDHRDYVLTCTLTSLVTGQVVGDAMGSCSTKESKYRFRTGEVTFTGEPVPPAYWDLRKDKQPEAIALLGGRGHSTKKNPDTGTWEIVVAGEKVEHDNPADNYNTVLKMAMKRAFIAAILSATAASDIFTQDLEDLSDVPLTAVQLASSDQIAAIERIWKASGRSVPALRSALNTRFHVRAAKDLTVEQAATVLDGIAPKDERVATDADPEVTWPGEGSRS
jgi:hypothetical protein